MHPALWLAAIALAWGVCVVTGWVAFVAWLRWRATQRTERQAPYRAAALLGAFGPDDTRDAQSEISDEQAAFDEEVARIRARVHRQWPRE